MLGRAAFVAIELRDETQSSDRPSEKLNSGMLTINAVAYSDESQCSNEKMQFEACQCSPARQE